jgi:hypothetical protein
VPVVVLATKTATKTIVYYCDLIPLLCDEQKYQFALTKDQFNRQLEAHDHLFVLFSCLFAEGLVEKILLESFEIKELAGIKAPIPTSEDYNPLFKCYELHRRRRNK